MVFGSLYINGKGVRNLIQCDWCNQPVEDDEYEEGFALHRLPEFLPERYTAPLCVTHKECAWPYIKQHTVPRDRWFSSALPALSDPCIHWAEVDIELMKRMEEEVME